MAEDVSNHLFHDPAWPIERFVWGVFVVRGDEHGDTGAGSVGVGRDIRIIGSKVKRWKERKGHRLKKPMIACVYGRDIEILVIGTGVNGAVEVPDKVIRAATAHGIARVIVQRTPDACQTYNRLFHEGARVALLAHGTC